MIQETFTKHDMPRITAIIAGFFGSCADDKQYTLEIKEKKKKRSVDANALAWAEMSEIAAKTGVEKTEVYRSYVKEIGGNSEILCIQNAAVEKFCENWRSHGIGWLTETMPSKITPSPEPEESLREAFKPTESNKPSFIFTVTSACPCSVE